MSKEFRKQLLSDLLGEIGRFEELWLSRGMKTMLFCSLLFLLLFSHSVVSNCLRPHGLHHARQSFTVLYCLPKFAQTHVIESVIPSNYLILCCPLLLSPSIFPSIRVFSSESALCIRWPKYWSFSFSISPSNEYSGLISFRVDCFDLLAAQGTLKSLLYHQFESITSLALSLLYGPVLTFVHDFWKNHSFD